MSVNVLKVALSDEIQGGFHRLSQRVMSEQPHLIPDWLQRASEENRQYYFDMQQSLENKERVLDEFLGETKSLTVFAQYHAREMIKTLTGEVIDPEQIFVSTRHTFHVGKQKVVQANRLTLPEFMINGLYDPATVPLEITLEGETLPSDLDKEDILEAMSSADMRSVYAKKSEEKYSSEPVLQALQAVLESRTDLSSFSAMLQGHISNDSRTIVASASRYEAHHSLGELSFGNSKIACQGMIVYCGPEGEEGACVLYAPQAPGGRTWYEFASIRQLNFHMFDWTKEPQGRSYLSRQAHASERGRTEAYMRWVQELPSEWRGIKRTPWSRMGEGVLRQGVLLHVSWLRGELEAVIPTGLRSATAYQQRYFARLNTELKALTRLAGHETALISYEKFAYDLIKKRVEGVLAENGETVTVDPDLIMVVLDVSQEMTLSQLIIKEHHITEESGPGHNPGVYPRIRLLPGHPPVSDLLIKYLPGWSRTLRPGEKYIDMLGENYLDENAPGYALKRDVYVNLQKHEMHRAALAELFSGRLERHQYERLEAIIDQLRNPESSHPIEADYPDSPEREGVYKFHLQGHQVQGVYVFRMMNKGMVEDLLYTPHAPDGLSFRPLAAFAWSVKVGGLGSYCCKRVKYTRQRVVSNYIDEVKRSSADTTPPALQVNSRVFNFSHCYSDMIHQIIDGVDAQTTSLIEIVGKLIYDAAVAAVAILSIPFAPIGLGLSAIVMTKAVLDGAKAYHEGDHETLFSSYLDCMLELTTMRIGKLGFSLVQKAIAKQLGNVNTCMGAVTACTGKTVNLAVITELMKEALAEPDSSERTILA